MSTTELNGKLKQKDENGNVSYILPDTKTDTTLSEPGKAADAAAVGEKVGPIEMPINTYSDLMANTVEGNFVDALAVKEGFENVANAPQFVVDETTGQITGYTTKIGGADTVFPFSGSGINVDYEISDYQSYTGSSSTGTTEFTVTIPSDGYYIVCAGYRINTTTETLTATVTVINTIENKFNKTTNEGSTAYHRNYVYLINATADQTFTYKANYITLIRLKNTSGVPRITSLYQKQASNAVFTFSYENISENPVILIHTGVSGYEKNLNTSWAYEGYTKPVIYTDILSIKTETTLGRGRSQIVQVDANSVINGVLWGAAYTTDDIVLVEY